MMLADNDDDDADDNDDDDADDNLMLSIDNSMSIQNGIIHVLIHFIDINYPNPNNKLLQSRSQ